MPGNELIGSEELKEVISVFTHGGGVLFGHGFEQRRQNSFKRVQFEKDLTKFFNCNAVASSSGTASLYTSLRALNVGPGDEVITQSYTFIATVEAIIAVGATPIICNINDTLNMCPEDLKNKITDKTKCIIPVHMQGNPAEMDKIISLTSNNNIKIIEDSCQSIGAKFKGDYVGTIGDLGTFSLDFGKTITTGEGGVVFTKNKKLLKFVTSYVDHGHANKKSLPRGDDVAYNCGFNFRMSELQAAVGIAQLKKLPFILEQYKKNKSFFKNIIFSELSKKLKFRRITDENEMSDGIIFFMPDIKSAEKGKNLLIKNNIYFKNLPDAIKWHSAIYWNHIWKNHSFYRKENNRDWKKSKELMDRSFSFSINILDDFVTLEKKAEKIIKYIKKVI